jgi:type II secretory pathway predicted ATPase ExeA
MTSKNQTIALKMVELSSRFIQHGDFRKLKNEFDRLYEKSDAEIKTGLRKDGNALVVTGASGCGKTTAIEHLFESFDDSGETRDVVSFLTPSPATLKMIGHNLLDELDYEIVANKASWSIWDQVRNQLNLQQVKFVHFDEAQDMRSSTTERENRNVVNTLKSLMQTKTWPVNLILTGTPELCELINSDPQLVRRCKPIHFKRIDALDNADEIISLLKTYCEAAGVIPDDDLYAPEFLSRLVTAADKEFGLLVEFILGGIEEALLSGNAVLSLQHFGVAFNRRTGAVAGLNPFLALNFQGLDVRKLLGGKGDNYGC